MTTMPVASLHNCQGKRMSWINVKSKSTKSETEYKFVGGGWLPVVMSSIMVSVMFIPYFIVLIRGNLNPFLPFVSQVAASPPQSGIFNLLLIFSSLLAFIGLNVFHMAIKIKIARLQDEWIQQTATLMNRITLIPGHIGIFGMITVGAFPIDFYRTSKEWFSITIIPHLTGAMSLFMGGLFYCISIAYLLSLLHPERKQLLGIRTFLICLITMCSALQGYTVQDAFMGELEDGHRLTECIIQPQDIPYNMSYLISSVCEWCLLLSFMVFFVTMKEEAKDICFAMTVTLKDEDEVDEKVNEDEAAKDDSNHNVEGKDKAPAETERKPPSGS